MSFLQKLKQRFAAIFSPTGFLCDTCKYNWGNACMRKERPNAKVCPEYKKK